MRRNKYYGKSDIASNCEFVCDTRGDESCEDRASFQFEFKSGGKNCGFDWLTKNNEKIAVEISNSSHIS